MKQDANPKLSVVVVFFNMRREAQRTLYSLSSDYQRHVEPSDYQVIVIDNSSSYPLSKEIVESFFGEIREALSKGEQVKLSGFGNYTPRDKSARPGRNPKTGEEIPIAPRRVVTFRAGQKLKSRVEGYVEPGKEAEAND